MSERERDGEGGGDRETRREGKTDKLEKRNQR